MIVRRSCVPPRYCPMDKPHEPPKRIQLKPGEDIWSAMLRELSSNPDSPASLQIMSAVNRAVQPRNAAAAQLIEALARQIEGQDSEVARSAVDAAKAYWEKTCGATLDEALLEQLREDARNVAEGRRRQPPPIASIVAGVGDRLDVGYSMGVHMDGIRGTWHRLWAAISTARLWGGPQPDETVVTLRGQFEALIGRPMSEAEWAQLTAHAHHHCDTVMKPMMEKVDENYPPSDGNDPPA